MQPFGAVEKIKESYQRFVETSFPIKDPLLQSEYKLIRVYWKKMPDHRVSPSPPAENDPDTYFPAHRMFRG